MRKTTIAIVLSIIIAIAGLYSYTRLSISSSVNYKIQQAENTDLKSQLTESQRAKDEGEKASVRAEVSKAKIRQQEAETKEKLRDNFTSIDDVPLSDVDIIELCKSYSYKDCVQYTP